MPTLTPDRSIALLSDTKSLSPSCPNKDKEDCTHLNSRIHGVTNTEHRHQ